MWHESSEPAVNPRQSSRRFARAFGLVIVVAAAGAATLPGCTGDYGERVVVRLDDLAHGPLDASAPRTLGYPQVTLRDETRVVLSNPGRSALLSRTHFDATLTLPHGATLEFGYALNATKYLAAPVFFSVVINDGQDSAIVFETSIDAEPQALARWRDARVDLAAWGGRKVEIVFQTSSTTTGIDASSGRTKAAGYFSAAVITTAATQPRPRSVILIALDTLRADHLGIYGYQRATSPQIDGIFGHDGVVIERAFSTATNTLPAHASMLFSVLPSVALEQRGNAEYLAAHTLSLAEVLRARGFRTAAFTENAYVTADLGFARGFGIYKEIRATEAGKTAHGHVEETLANGLAWIESHRDRPFFAFLHTYQVHSPYTPPEEFGSLFQTPGNQSATEADLDNYDREIAYTDEELGKFIARLGKLGLLDDTLLIVTSDHGEEFGEHGYRYHGPTLHDEVLRIPLLMRAPGLLPRQTRRTQPMSLVDLPPTILGLLEYPIPEAFRGRSMAEHISAAAAIALQPIYSEAHALFAVPAPGKTNTWISPAFAVTSWPHRVIRSNTKRGIVYEHYDLEADPLEKTNLATGSAGNEFAALRALLEDYETRAAAEKSRLASMASSAAAAGPPVTLGQDVIDKLQALGYLE